MTSYTNRFGKKKIKLTNLVIYEQALQLNELKWIKMLR